MGVLNSDTETDYEKDETMEAWGRQRRKKEGEIMGKRESCIRSARGKKEEKMKAIGREEAEESKTEKTGL